MFDSILKLKKIFAYVAAAVFAAISVSGVIYYIIYPSGAFFHADCSDTILWAQASYDSGSLFNPDFGYAAMLPFGGTMLMIPFIGIFGVSMTTRNSNHQYLPYPCTRLRNGHDYREQQCR